MTDSNAVPAGRFKKGDDPRRNCQGQKSKDAVAFGAAFSRALANGGDPQALADMLWDKALKGQSWAADMLLDRLIGKVTQPVESDQRIVYRVIYEKPKPKGETDANS